jgi:hypothetical protein
MVLIVLMGGFLVMPASVSEAGVIIVMQQGTFFYGYRGYAPPVTAYRFDHSRRYGLWIRGPYGKRYFRPTHPYYRNHHVKPYHGYGRGGLRHMHRGRHGHGYAGSHAHRHGRGHPGGFLRYRGHRR